MSADQTVVMDEVASSQPPPAVDGSPWGSFYTGSGSGTAPPKAPKKSKSKKARRSRGADRRSRSERREIGDRRANPVEPASGEEPTSSGRGSLTGGGRRIEDKRRSFRLRRRPGKSQAEAPAPVMAAARSRRYAEPHVLVGVVGGTLIALAALMIALLYMIGTAA